MDDIAVIASPAVHRYIREQESWIDHWHTELLKTTDHTKREILYKRIKAAEQRLRYPWDHYTKEVEGA